LDRTVRRPRAQNIVDWRHNFVVKNPDTGEVIHNISHHFPFDPKVGEFWEISTWGYGGPANYPEEQIIVEIDRIMYEWIPQRHDNDHLSGWFLEVNLFCHLSEGAVS